MPQFLDKKLITPPDRRGESWEQLPLPNLTLNKDLVRVNYWNIGSSTVSLGISSFICDFEDLEYINYPAGPNASVRFQSFIDNLLKKSEVFYISGSGFNSNYSTMFRPIYFGYMSEKPAVFYEKMGGPYSMSYLTYEDIEHYTISYTCLFRDFNILTSA